MREGRDYLALKHVVNAYTRAAEASYRLQKVGGMVLGIVK